MLTWHTILLMVIAGMIPSLADAAANTHALPPVAYVVQSLDGKKRIDVDDWLQKGGRRILVYGTYAADFNSVEYGQRLRYYWPKLQSEKNVQNCAFLLNCQPSAANRLVQLLDLPINDTRFEIWIDNTGEAAREFGVQRGWLPDNTEINPFVKLFGMLWGLGAWATLPAVLGGYVGNPFISQPWITDAMAVGQRLGRWPNTALEMKDNEVVKNNFDGLPFVGTWPRRPLELATLRLQSMLGVSLKYWNELAPDKEALDAGVLTQVSNEETILFPNEARGFV
jgi:hypothetical protein